MSTGAVSFVLGDAERSPALDLLTGSGFEAEAPAPVHLTALDTFDGRLHRAGMSLVLVDAEAPTLVLGGDGVVEARLVVDRAPRFATDLPPGPFRSRLGSMLDVRALLPRLEVTASVSRFHLTDRAGKTIATAACYHELQVAAPGSTTPPPPVVVLEVREVVGYPRPAERVRRALEALGPVGHDGDVLATVAGHCGIDLAGHAPSVDVPLDASAPAVEGFRLVLSGLSATIDANWQGTIERIDPEFLHDLRVAVRRTRAVLAEGGAVLPPEVRATARDRFAWLASQTGLARDLDVYLIGWDGYVGPLGGSGPAALEPARELLQRRLDTAYRELGDALASDAANELRTWWARALAELTTIEPQGRRADRPLGRVVRKRVAVAQERLVAEGRRIGPATPGERLHELRKDAKKLRYLIECSGTILPKGPRKRFTKSLKALQDNLGEHQDAEVHVAMLRGVSQELHAQGVPPETLLALGQLTERLEHVRLAARAEFAERFAAYDTKATHRAFGALLDGIER